MKSNFNEFLLYYKSLDYDFDFLCFAETNIEQEEINQFSIGNNYNCDILPKKAEKHKGSGLVLYYKKSLNFSVLDSLCRNNSHYEMLGGKLKTDIGFIYIICVYRLHKSNDETFCQELEDLTESLDNPCLIFGDFNYNCFAYNNVEINNHDNIMRYINMFMSNGFSPLISRGTRFDNKNNKAITCIDQIWFNLVNRNIKSGIFEDTSSDHQPIFVLFPSDSSTYIDNDNNSGTKTYKTYNVSSKTVESFSIKVDNLVRDHILRMDNISTSTGAASNFSSFHNDLSSIHNECFLETVSAKSHRTYNNNLWITTAAAKSCKVKHLLYKNGLEQKVLPKHHSYMNNTNFIDQNLEILLGNLR